MGKTTTAERWHRPHLLENTTPSQKDGCQRRPQWLESSVKTSNSIVGFDKVLHVCVEAVKVTRCYFHHIFASAWQCDYETLFTCWLKEIPGRKLSFRECEDEKGFWENIWWLLFYVRLKSWTSNFPDTTKRINRILAALNGRGLPAANHFCSFLCTVVSVLI